MRRKPEWEIRQEIDNYFSKRDVPVNNLYIIIYYIFIFLFLFKILKLINYKIILNQVNRGVNR